MPSSLAKRHRARDVCRRRTIMVGDERPPAWSVLRIPGWRDLTPAALDIAIRLTIISGHARRQSDSAKNRPPA
jgi:hypothetical protein